MKFNFTRFVHSEFFYFFFKGGMKAVVWTDFFQSLMMYASIIVIVIKGALDIGGFDIVWQKALEGERIEFFRYVSTISF